MNTELPRAEKLLGVSEAKDFFMELNLVQKEVEKQLPFEREYSEWYDQNPEPEKPDEMSYAEWEQSDKYKAHESKVNAYAAESMSRGGFEGSTFEQLSESYDLYLQRVNAALKPRALTYNCWDHWDSDCVYALDYETNAKKRETKSELNSLIDVAPKALAEAIAMQAELVSKITTEATEIATVTCNTNGFYE